MSGESAEGIVAEDDVGWKSALDGESGAESAEFVEEIAVDAFPCVLLCSSSGGSIFGGACAEEFGGCLSAEELSAGGRYLEAVVFAGLSEEALGVELIDPGFDLSFGLIAKESPGGELVVAVFDDAFGAGPFEHLSGVADAVAFLEADDAGEDFLSDDE